MNRLKLTLTIVLCCLAGNPGLCAVPIIWTPGQYDKQVIDELHASVTPLQLGKTSLKDIAPQYWLAVDPKLSWDEALKEAEKAYADDPVRKWLFLAHYLKEGDPASRLDELRTHSICIDTLICGGGYCSTFCLKEKPDSTVKIENTPPAGATPIVVNLEWHVGIRIVYYQKILSPSCTITLHDFTVKGITYASLDFDEDGILRSFSRHIEPAKAVQLIVNGDSSKGHQDLYYAWVDADGKRVETIGLSQDRTIGHRTVLQPDGINKRYEDYYAGKKLVKRIWYTATGAIDQTETF